MCRYCDVNESGFGARIGGDDIHFNYPDGMITPIDQRIVATYDNDKFDLSSDRGTFYIRTFMGDDWINSFPVFYCPMCGKKLEKSVKHTSFDDKGHLPFIKADAKHALERLIKYAEEVTKV